MFHTGSFSVIQNPALGHAMRRIADEVAAGILPEAEVLKELDKIRADTSSHATDADKR